MALDLNTSTTKPPSNVADLLAKIGDLDLMGSLDPVLFPAQGNDWTFGNQIFSSTLALIGGLILAYHVLAGIVCTAYEGKVLGERWHQIWAPLRVVLGFALLIPSQSNGLSTVDKLPQTSLHMGNNFGNAIATAGVEYRLSDKNVIAPISVAGRDLAQQIAKAEVCAFTLRQAYQRELNGWTGETPPPPLPDVTPQPIVSPAKKAWLWGEDTPARITGWMWDYGLGCGTVSFSAPTTSDFGDFGQFRNEEVGKMIQSIRDDLNITKGIKHYYEKQSTSWNTKEISLHHVDVAIRTGLLPDNLLPRLNKLGDQYNEAIATKATELSVKLNEDAKKQIRDGVKTYGWFTLGSMSRTLARVHEVAYGFAGERPGYSQPDSKAWGGYKDEVEFMLTFIDKQMDRESHDLARFGEALRNTDKDAGILADIVNEFTNPVHEYLTGYKGWRSDPTGDMANLGNALLIAAETAFYAAIAAIAVASALSAVTQAPRKVVEFVMWPGSYLIGGMALGGGALALVLPNIPYIFFVFTAVVIAMETMAFVIAGKLWAFAHIRMDGPDFINQHQAIGYQLLFSNFLRQPITALSFFGTSYINVWAHNLLLATWSMAYTASLGNKPMTVFTLIFGFIVMLFLQWHIQLRIYSLMLEMTQRVAAIMGHHAAGWGDSHHGEAVTAGAMAIVASNSRPALRAVGGPKKPAPSKLKNEDDKPNSGSRPISSPLPGEK